MGGGGSGLPSTRSRACSSGQWGPGPGSPHGGTWTKVDSAVYVEGEWCGQEAAWYREVTQEREGTWDRNSK